MVYTVFSGSLKFSRVLVSSTMLDKAVNMSLVIMPLVLVVALVFPNFNPGSVVMVVMSTSVEQLANGNNKRIRVKIEEKST